MQAVSSDRYRCYMVKVTPSINAPESNMLVVERHW